jgi:hypothetical protein
MEKIRSLFVRDYKGTRCVVDQVVPTSEWVINGEGIATLKLDGTCCKIEGGIFYKRYDRKLTKAANKRLKQGGGYTLGIEDYRLAPDGWQAAESEPNQHTGHWPGWVAVNGAKPEDRWHQEGFYYYMNGRVLLGDGTYELVGPKVQGNPYNLDHHMLWKHGTFPIGCGVGLGSDVPRTFDGLKTFLEDRVIEGIVWHHPDGRMVKIKRRDFGFEWPVK